MAPTTILALKTAEVMKGRKWDRELVEIVNESLINEIPLIDSAPGGNVNYRRSLTLSLFFKVFLQISQDLENLLGVNLLSEKERSGVEIFHSLTPKSTQLFEKVINESNFDPIHKPMMHSSALKQATGEAVYCDDIPRQGEYFLRFFVDNFSFKKFRIFRRKF